MMSHFTSEHTKPSFGKMICTYEDKKGKTWVNQLPQATNTPLMGCKYLFTYMLNGYSKDVHLVNLKRNKLPCGIGRGGSPHLAKRWKINWKECSSALNQISKEKKTRISI